MTNPTPAGPSQPGEWVADLAACTVSFTVRNFRPAVVHHETDTYITTYTALDPLRSAGGTVALDGFFGWPLTTMAS